MNRARAALAVAAGGLLLAGFAATDSLGSAPSASTQLRPERSTGVNPEMARLSPREYLDQLVAPGGASGIVWARMVGAARTVRSESSSADVIAMDVFSDYIAEVVDSRGPASATYRAGARIVVRVPGLAAGGRLVDVSDGPSLTDGEEVMLLVRDQGTLGGGNAAARIVATMVGQDVFRIQGGEVRGEGSFWDDFAEPPSEFLRHFG